MRSAGRVNGDWNPIGRRLTDLNGQSHLAVGGFSPGSEERDATRPTRPTRKHVITSTAMRPSTDETFPGPGHHSSASKWAAIAFYDFVSWNKEREKKKRRRRPVSCCNAEEPFLRDHPNKKKGKRIHFFVFPATNAMDHSCDSKWIWRFGVTVGTGPFPATHSLREMKQRFQLANSFGLSPAGRWPFGGLPRLCGVAKNPKKNKTKQNKTKEITRNTAPYVAQWSAPINQSPDWPAS